MAGYRPTQIRKPANETEFEKNCVILFKELLKDPRVKRLGTRGQGQDGVDLVGHRDQDAKQIVGVQCKLKSGRSKLTEKEVREEVNAALGYKPPLSEYFVVTTSKDDTKLDQLAQQLMQDIEAEGRNLHIEIWGWDTLQEAIDQHESAKLAFDPGFSPSIASQNRKLDEVLFAQTRTATKEQVAALAASLERAGAPVLTLPSRYADRELVECLSRVLRRRGFVGTDVPHELAELACRVIDGDLSLASNALRSEVCDRAARANANTNTPEAGRRLLGKAAEIDPSRDLFIADALLKDAEGKPSATLRLLKTRSDPESRSALFVTLMHQQGADAAIAWAHKESLAPSDLTAAATMNFVLSEIHRGAFDDALRIISEAPTEYFDQCPALLLLRGQLTVASVLPADQRGVIFQGLPMDPRVLEFEAGRRSREQTSAALGDLRALLGTLANLNLKHLENFLTEFELWLRLENITTRDDARAQLAAEIGDPGKTLQRVRLALAYEVPFNVEALQRHLAGQKDIGGWTPDERFAAFLIAYHSGDPEKVAEFFGKHHDDLFNQADLARGVLAGIEIEVLARTGRFEEAQQHIARHRKADLTPEQADQLAQFVSNVEKGDEIESLRQQYEESRSLADLRLLVAALRSKRDSRQLAAYAPTLARATRTLEDFHLAIKSLFRNERLSDVLTLTEDLPEIYALDDEFAAIKGWALYGLGRVIEARAIALRLLDRRTVAGDRELAINTAIESGDWGHLQAVLAREAMRSGDLQANDLMRLARLAQEAGSPYADHFRDEALRKAPDDPNVNFAAYVMATERGEEFRGQEAQAHEWFQKAIEKSGPTGPVRSISMRELVDRAPSWNEHADRVDQALRRAEVPLFVAAREVRRQLLHLTLGQILQNSDPDNSRTIQYPVFAFSGALPLRDLTTSRSVAFDVTALVTLDYLGLLEKALAHFERPVIAPRTLSMLFMERQFLKVQQPSEIAKAKRIQVLIASKRLGVLPSPELNVLPEATREIGRDLAALLSAAQREGGLVVRTAPVPKLGSFLEESADMHAHTHVLTDTLSVLSFLANSGKIDAPTRKSAEAYFGQVDRGWDTPQVIKPTSLLFLDDLAVHYLDYVGVLEALTHSVAAIFVHEDLDKRTQELIRHEKQTEELLKAIERIRGVICSRTASGLIGFSGRHREEDEEKDAAVDAVPTLDLLSDLSNIDAVIADDRCLSKLPFWADSSGHKALSGTVVDVLAALKGAGKITEEAYWSARHKLRAAGYYAVPLDAIELQHFASTAPIVDGHLRETPELRAVRENLAIPLVNNCFISTEGVWFVGACYAVCSAIREVWLRSTDFEHAEVQANWLLSVLPNPLEWCLAPQNDAVWTSARQQAAGQVALMMVFEGTSIRHRKRYFAWLEEKVLAPTEFSHPEIWRDALDFLKSYIPRFLKADDGNAR